MYRAGSGGRIVGELPLALRVATRWRYNLSPGRESVGTAFSIGMSSEGATQYTSKRFVPPRPGLNPVAGKVFPRSDNRGWDCAAAARLRMQRRVAVPRCAHSRCARERPYFYRARNLCVNVHNSPPARGVFGLYFALTRRYSRKHAQNSAGHELRPRPNRSTSVIQSAFRDSRPSIDRVRLFFRGLLRAGHNESPDPLRRPPLR